MNIQDRVYQVKKIAGNDKDAITMLLSACADMGSANGALLSVKAFDNAADHILLYFKESPNKSMHSDLSGASPLPDR